MDVRRFDDRATNRLPAAEGLRREQRLESPTFVKRHVRYESKRIEESKHRGQISGQTTFIQAPK